MNDRASGRHSAQPGDMTASFVKRNRFEPHYFHVVSDTDSTRSPDLQVTKRSPLRLVLDSHSNTGSDYGPLRWQKLGLPWRRSTYQAAVAVLALGSS